MTMNKASLPTLIAQAIRAAFHALDDSEELKDGNHLISKQHADEMEKAFEALELWLPPEPGFTGGPANNAEYAVKLLTKWQPMMDAPKNAREVLLLVKPPSGMWYRMVAHWAHGGGEDQPPFGPGWFYRGAEGFHEIPRGHEPMGWIQLPESI